MQIPLVVGGLILGLTSLVLKSNDLPDDGLQKTLFVAVTLLLAIVGVWMLRVVQEQYDWFIDNIIHLYRQMGSGEPCFRREVDDKES